MPDELAVELGKRFIERRDVKAHQGPDGQWYPVTERPAYHQDGPGERLPWRMTDLEAHVAGQQTMGHYMVSKDNTCKLFAFDIDLTKSGWLWPIEKENGELSLPSLDPVQCNPREVWLDLANPYRSWFTVSLRCVADTLARRTYDMVGCPVAIATSGRKGLHVYGFTGTTTAADARNAAIMVLQSFVGVDGKMIFQPTKGSCFFGAQNKNVEIEVFPKQDTVTDKDLGNLMKLPLGVHRATGAQSRFITSKVGYDRLVAMDPMEVLQGRLPWQ